MSLLMNRTILRKQCVTRLVSCRGFTRSRKLFSPKDEDDDSFWWTSGYINTWKGSSGEDTTSYSLAGNYKRNLSWKRVMRNATKHPLLMSSVDSELPPPPFSKGGVDPLCFSTAFIGNAQAIEDEVLHRESELGQEITHPNLAKGYRENHIIVEAQRSIPISFVDGPQLISLRWLRDNCRCHKCRRLDTMQREVNIFSSDLVEIPSCIGRVLKEGLEVTWLDETSYGTDPGHVTLYPWDWLHKYDVHRDQETRVKTDNYEYAFVVHQDTSSEMDTAQPIAKPSADAQSHQVVLWDSLIKENPPSVHYDEVMASNSGVGKWTRMIHNYGFCFVNGVPVCPEKTQELLERIAFIRPTHYGGFYDFTADLTMKDTAYTSEAIGPHTDTTYFTDPAGLQMFHLLSHTDGTGGESLLVDGFLAARLLDETSKETLSEIHIPWHASGNEGINITPNKPYPVVTRDLDLKPVQIRWNEADRGTVPGHHSQRWYMAAKLFHDRVNDPKAQYWEQLVPGRALIFDNARILHGRSEFTGNRRICGGYINHDDYVSRYLNTNFTREEIMRKIL